MNTGGTRDTGKTNTGENCSPGKQVFCIYNVQNFKIYFTRPKVTHFFKINTHKHMRNVPETPWYLEMFQVRQKTTKMSKDSELSKTRPFRSESRDFFHIIFL